MISRKLMLEERADHSVPRLRSAVGQSIGLLRLVISHLAKAPFVHAHGQRSPVITRTIRGTGG